LVYRYAGRLDDAIGELRTALELAPDIPEAHGWVGQILLQRDEATAALAEILQEPDDFARLSALPMAYWALGRRKESDAALDELINRYGTLTPSAVATVLAFRGEADRAFEWLEKAARQRDTGLGSIPVYPMLANIHPDPRWLPFLRKVGMAPEQLAAIKFDVKVPQ
jgi:tetratricopeptide (TPR) repeat protein